jgi:hypothetical protein
MVAPVRPEEAALADPEEPAAARADPPQGEEEDGEPSGRAQADGKGAPRSTRTVAGRSGRRRSELAAEQGEELAHRFLDSAMGDEIRDPLLQALGEPGVG